MKKIGRRIGVQENRGLTLVELMITIGILSIVVIIAGSFMLTSGNSFAKGNADATVQDEAQLAVNQIEDLIIDGVGVEESEDADKKELVLYHTEETETGTSFIKEVVVWKKDGSNNMYYSKWKVVEDPATGSFVEDGAALYPEQLLAENVTDFKVDLETVKEKTADGTEVTVVKSVQIAVGCESGVGAGNAAYATTPLITLRNRMIQGDPKSVFKDVPVSDDTLVLFIADEGAGEGTAVPIVDRVTTVDRGSGYNIFAMRESVTNVNDLVYWQIEEGDTTSTIDANGVLHVGQFEPNSYLTVIARYKSSPNKMAKGVVKVEGGTTKSLDAVKITTKSLTPFNPKYGSIVTTTGFSEEERAALHYKWTVSDPDKVESFTDNTSGLELTIRKAQENYGKTFTITLVVSSDVTGQSVSDSITYRIDQEGTSSGDSNMERGKGGGDGTQHGYNQYGFKAPFWSPTVTYDYYFCDEYGNYISSLDSLKSCILLGPNSGHEYYTLSFTTDLPPDRDYFVKVLAYYYNPWTQAEWTYERIHYIGAVHLSGMTTETTNTLETNRAEFFFDTDGYEELAWNVGGDISSLPVEYSIEEIEYEAPEGVTVSANVVLTVTRTESMVRGELEFDCSDWSQAKQVTLKKIVVKITLKGYPDICTYSTIIFK